MTELVYPELSYKIIGIAFSIFNEVGFIPNEKQVQRLFEIGLKDAGLKYEKEKYIKLVYKGQLFGKYFIDFTVEDKIVIELKVRSQLGYVYAKQLLEYLRQANKKLGILIFFTKDGIKYRRILNSRI